MYSPPGGEDAESTRGPGGGTFLMAEAPCPDWEGDSVPVPVPSRGLYSRTLKKALAKYRRSSAASFRSTIFPSRTLNI